MKIMNSLAFLGLATSASAQVSQSGIPYVADNQIQQSEIADALRARRSGHKLLKLDLILLHSPNLARGWNTMFAAVRGQLSLQPRLRELAIMAVAVLNKAEYEWVAHESEFLSLAAPKNN